MCAGHDGHARLDPGRRPPLQPPPAAAAPQHDARARPRAARRRPGAAGQPQRGAASARPPALPADPPRRRARLQPDRLGRGARHDRRPHPRLGGRPDRASTSPAAACPTRRTTPRRRRPARSGTNSIDNAARVCHSPSTFGLKEALGVGATTCSYTDWIGSDLVVFVGSNPANNQPVTMKYLYNARKQGTKVAVVNSYREPGMERYWVPSAPESALFGTKMTDRFFMVGVGGDIAFFSGALKHMVENGWVDRSFVDEHTAGFGELEASLAGDGLGGARACVRLHPRGDARVRAHGRGGAHGRVRVEHGHHPARVRRGQRALDPQPRAQQGLRGPREVRADADPRSLGRAGRGRDGLLFNCLPGRAAGQRGERGHARLPVGLPRARRRRGSRLPR